MSEYVYTIKGSWDFTWFFHTRTRIIILYKRSHPSLLFYQSFLASIFVSINRSEKRAMTEHTKKHVLNSGSIILNITQIQLLLYRSMATNSRLKDVTSESYGSMRLSASEAGSRGYFSFSINTLRRENNL